MHRLVKLGGGLSFKLAPTVKGLPDRLVVLPHGQVFLVELKAVGGRLSPAQRVLHRRLAQRGVEVKVLTGPGEVRAWVDRATTLNP